MSVSCGEGQIVSTLAIKYQELLSQQMAYFQQLQVPHPLIATSQTLYFSVIITVAMYIYIVQQYCCINYFSVIITVAMYIYIVQQYCCINYFSVIITVAMYIYIVQQYCCINYFSVIITVAMYIYIVQQYCCINYFSVIITVAMYIYIVQQYCCINYFSRHYGLVVQAEVQTLTDPLDEVKREVSVEEHKNRLLVERE